MLTPPWLLSQNSKIPLFSRVATSTQPQRNSSKNINLWKFGTSRIISKVPSVNRTFPQQLSTQIPERNNKNKNKKEASLKANKIKTKKDGSTSSSLSKVWQVGLVWILQQEGLSKASIISADDKSQMMIIPLYFSFTKAT